uniref:CSON010140 protein n=1 Tax=Culicoides sonorensis TaxID=179676 RepID=A0A336LPH4_CULSO
MPASNQAYTNQVLKVAVAQICQTIGFNSVQSTPMEVMIDVLHNYIRELCILTKDYAEHYNRTEPNLEDVTLAYQYMEYVDPIPFALPIPKYPIPKESHLNFLKPGSQEVLTRPMHIPEYMPPMQPPESEEEVPVNNNEEKPSEEVNLSVKDELMLSPTAGAASTGPGQQGFFKKPSDFPLPSGASEAQRRIKFDGMEGLKETREISSVIMTTSGFISPAREGKLPDSKPPIIIPDKRPSPPPPPVVAAPLPVSNMDNKFEEKPGKKKTHDTEKEPSKKKKVKKELFHPQPPLPSTPHVSAPPLPETPRHPPIQAQAPMLVPPAHQKPSIQHPPNFPGPFTEDTKSHIPIIATPPMVPRKPGRPRKSESLTPGVPMQKDKLKKPKNPDAKLMKQIKKMVIAGQLPPLPMHELINLVKSQPGFLPATSSSPAQVSNPNSMNQFMPSGPPSSSMQPSNIPFSGKMEQNPMIPRSNFDGKLSSESDKSKLNIFKKMPSSSKMVQHDFPSTSMMKSEMFQGSHDLSPQKHKLKTTELEPSGQFSSPANINKPLDLNRSPIEDLTMPTTPQYMPRTPDMKMASWNKEKGILGDQQQQQKKPKKEKPEKKLKKIKTPPPLMQFFNSGPDLQNPLNRMNIPGMPGFPQMPQIGQSGSSMSQPRFPFFPNLLPSGPGLIPNNAFFPGPFGNPAQFGAPPFNMSSLFPGDLLQNINKMRTQLEQTTSPLKDKFNESPSQSLDIKPPQCNVPPLLPPTILEQNPSLLSPGKSKVRPNSPPSIMKLPKDTVAIPIEPSKPSSSTSHNLPPQLNPIQMSKNLTVEALDQVTVKNEIKLSKEKDPNSSASSSGAINFDTVDLTSPPQHTDSGMKDKDESRKDKKLKKKSKKKDKLKEKDRDKDKSERKKDKEERKREKKEKRREKERLAFEQNKILSSNTDSIDNSDSSLASVPKLTLKLGMSGDSSRPNTPDIQKKMTIKSTFTKKKESEMSASPLHMTISTREPRDSSPELAKISALVTHPPKQKSSHKRKHDEDVFSGEDSKSSSKHMKSPSSGGESKKHKKSSTQPSTSSSVEPPETLKAIKEDDGQQIWICPACGQVDNGTPMIGCDGCDAWYHWVCVGIQVPPDANEDWYCRVCISRKQDSQGSEKKKKRKKNKEKPDREASTNSWNARSKHVLSSLYVTTSTDCSSLETNCTFSSDPASIAYIIDHFPILLITHPLKYRFGFAMHQFVHKIELQSWAYTPKYCVHLSKVNRGSSVLSRLNIHEIPFQYCSECDHVVSIEDSYRPMQESVFLMTLNLPVDDA